jgi:hypothetical protein
VADSSKTGLGDQLIERDSWGGIHQMFLQFFYDFSTIFLRFFYDYSLRAFTVFSAQNPSQPQQGKSFPEFGMHQIFLQFFHKIAVESLFPY